MKNLLKVANELSSEKKFDEALDLLQSIPDQYMSSEIYVKRACLMRLSENHTFPLYDEDSSQISVESELKNALDLAPNSIEVLYESGMFNYVIMDDYKKSLQFFLLAKGIAEDVIKEIDDAIAECKNEMEDDSK